MKIIKLIDRDIYILEDSISFIYKRDCKTLIYLKQEANCYLETEEPIEDLIKRMETL